MPSHAPLIVPVNLATTEVASAWIPVGPFMSMTADIQVAAAFTWSTAVVKMQWTVLIGDYEKAIDFDPAVTFTTSKTARVNIKVGGKPYVRFLTSTAEPTNDPAANAVVSML